MLPAVKRNLVQAGLAVMGGWSGILVMVLALAWGMAWPKGIWLAPAFIGAAALAALGIWWLAGRSLHRGSAGARRLVFAWLSGAALLGLFLVVPSGR